MNDVQRQAAAMGFIHALKQSEELRKELVRAYKENLAAVGRLVQKTLGLQSPPSAADLEAMRAYAATALMPHVTDIKQMRGGAEMPAVCIPLAIESGGS